MGSRRKEFEFFFTSFLDFVEYFLVLLICSKNINNEKYSLYREYCNSKKISLIN